METPNAANAAEPSPSIGTKLTKADEARFSALYKKGWRTLRRWIEWGEKSGIPCPLHDPRALMTWWPRHSSWRVPPEVEEAALAASIQPSDSNPSQLAPSPIPAPSAPLSHPIAGKKIDLESFDPEEGDRLRELRQIQSARFSQLKDDMRLGHDTNLAESRYIKISETIDKIETRAVERAKKRGLYILKESVDRDLAAAAELLRQSRAAMKRRIIELCPSLGLQPALRAEVEDAIERARATEERMLCRLDCLTADDLLRELAA